MVVGLSLRGRIDHPRDAQSKSYLEDYLEKYFPTPYVFPAIQGYAPNVLAQYTLRCYQVAFLCMMNYLRSQRKPSNAIIYIKPRSRPVTIYCIIHKNS